MPSRRVPKGEGAAFEEDGTKNDEEMKEHVSSRSNPEGTEESTGTGSDQSLEPLEPKENIVTEGNILLSCNISQESTPALANSTSHINTSRNEMDLIPGTSFNDGPQQDPPPTRSSQPIDKVSHNFIGSTTICQTSYTPSYFPEYFELMWYLISISLILFTFHAVLQESPPSNNIRGQTSNHRGVDVQLANDTFQDQRCEVQSCSNETEQPVPVYNLHRVNGTANERYMASMLRQEPRQQHYQNVVHTEYHTADTCIIDMEPTIDEATEIEVNMHNIPPVSDHNLHPVNGTANESYMARMSRQEPRQQHYQNVVHTEYHTADTCIIDMEPTIDEATEVEVNMHNIQPVSDHNLHPVNGTANESYMASMLRQEPRQHHYQNVIHMKHDADEGRSTKVEDCRTRPPEIQPQGIRPGGWIWDDGGWHYLYKTCNLDQFLNGLHQICRFPPLLQLLQKLAWRFPESYWHLWEAVRLCKEGRFAEAKFYLVPNVYDMLSSEGVRVMPLIERQLCHWFITRCERCQTSSTGLREYNISFREFNHSTGLQEAFRSHFFRHGVCRQEGCDGRTTSDVVFESGTPPLILAVNLYTLRHHIPNSQSINDGEIVQLFGERYMMFVFSFAQPNKSEQKPGHYMSRVFIPEDGTDTEGRPEGRWYFYLNNQAGDLQPWTTDQRDPDGTSPSYLYLIRIPALSEAAPCTGQGEEESPHSEDNKDDG